MTGCAHHTHRLFNLQPTKTTRALAVLHIEPWFYINGLPLNLFATQNEGYINVKLAIYYIAHTHTHTHTHTLQSLQSSFYTL